MPALSLQYALKPKPQGSFWVLVVPREEELLERVFVIGSFWPGCWWYLPWGLHALVTPLLEWDLLLRNRIWQSDEMSLLWLDYKDCDFHLAGGLYCLLSLYPLMEQAAMLARPMGQETRDSLWLTAHEKLNSADNHTSELGSRFFTSWATRWLHLQPTSWLQPVRDPESEDPGFQTYMKLCDNKCSYFKPLNFGVICYATMHSWERAVRRLPIWEQPTPTSVSAAVQNLSPPHAIAGQKQLWLTGKSNFQAFREPRAPCTPFPSFHIFLWVPGISSQKRGQERRYSYCSVDSHFHKEHPWPLSAPLADSPTKEVRLDPCILRQELRRCHPVPAGLSRLHRPAGRLQCWLPLTRVAKASPEGSAPAGGSLQAEGAIQFRRGTRKPSGSLSDMRSNVADIRWVSLCLISHWLQAQQEREGFYSLSPSQISMYIFTIIMLLNEDTKEAVIERKDQATGSLRVVATGSWDKGWSACLGCAFVSLLSAVTVCLCSCVPLRDQGQWILPHPHLPALVPLLWVQHAIAVPGSIWTPGGVSSPLKPGTPGTLWSHTEGLASPKHLLARPLGLSMVGVRAAPPHQAARQLLPLPGTPDLCSMRDFLRSILYPAQSDLWLLHLMKLHRCCCSASLQDSKRQ